MNDEDQSVSVAYHDQPVGIETGWENPPTLSILKQDLTNATPIHDTQTAKIAEWERYRKGKTTTPKGEGQSKIQPKLIRKQAEWRYAALSEPFLSTPDLYNINPVTWEDVPGARQNSLILNNQFQTQIDRVAFIDAYVRSAVDDGTIIVRVGWDFEEREVPKQEPVYSFSVAADMMDIYQKMAQVEQENPVYLLNYPQQLQDGYEILKSTGIPYALTPIGVANTTEMKTIKNCPTVEVCDLNNLYVDPSCKGDLDNAKFVIYSFETSLAELKADGRYKNLENINVSNSSPLTEQNYEAPNDPNFQPEGKPRKRIVAYEYWGYWDTDNSGLLRPIVATWVNGILIRLEENPFPDKKIPFVSVPYLPVKNSIYGEPDAELLKDNQDIIGAVTRGMIDLLGKSANSQTGFAKNMLDETNKRKFQRGDDYEFNPGTDPRVGIHTHTFPEIPQSAQFMLQLMNTDAESLTGVKSFSGAEGISGSGLGQTAAGVRGALDAASKRELGILRRLSNGLIKIGRKIIAMNAEFLDEETVVRITEDEFVPIRRDDLPGNYDLRLTISTAEDDQAKAQQLAFMLQTSAQTLGPDFSKLFLAEIARLNKMPDMVRKIEQYQPQPDPMQQMMQQKQLELLQAQIDLTRAQAMAEGSKGQLNQVKQGTEMAKAGQIQSQTDKNSLDFLQTQNGVKHQQALEMEQAKGDTLLAAQALKQQGTLDQIQAQHQSGLLQQLANTRLNHNSQLQLLRAQRDLNPPTQSTGNKA